MDKVQLRSSMAGDRVYVVVSAGVHASLLPCVCVLI